MPRPWEGGLALLRAPALELSFALRSTLRWSRGTARLPHEPKEPWLRTLSPARQAEVAALVARHDLGALAAVSTVATFASCLQRLAVLERLDQARPVGPDGVVRAADFGCGDFHYAIALQRWLAGPGEPRRQVVLRGFELDGHGLYRDGHSRADHARAHAALAAVDGGMVRFEVADATSVRLPEQDLVTLFFPFLGPFACLRWGLPLSRLRPRRLLRAAVRALRPGGWLLVANQTPAEHARLSRWLRPLPVTALAQVPMASDLVPWADSTTGQVLSVWRREELRGCGSGG
jgi:SAM-dependent methyltransferase